MKFLLALLSLTPLAGYRRIVGVVALGSSALVRYVICDPAIDAAVPVLASTCLAIPSVVLVVLDALGGWSGLAGSAAALSAKGRAKTVALAAKDKANIATLSQKQ